MTSPQTLEDLRMQNGDDQNWKDVLDNQGECGVDRPTVSDGPLFITVRKRIKIKINFLSTKIKRYNTTTNNRLNEHHPEIALHFHLFSLN